MAPSTVTTLVAATVIAVVACAVAFADPLLLWLQTGQWLARHELPLPEIEPDGGAYVGHLAVRFDSYLPDTLVKVAISRDLGATNDSAFAFRDDYAFPGELLTFPPHDEFVIAAKTTRRGAQDGRVVVSMPFRRIGADALSFLPCFFLFFHLHAHQHVHTHLSADNGRCDRDHGRFQAEIRVADAARAVACVVHVVPTRRPPAAVPRPLHRVQTRRSRESCLLLLLLLLLYIRGRLTRLAP